ncbi:MAG: 4'-phosphopantetheinyl transferase superfamily protein [Deltaproteobacteria bacterium]|nr:4'-phosphopantetheinyl transferase superfamily protein [Deltaproteobacteria bacterium]
MSGAPTPTIVWLSHHEDDLPAGIDWLVAPEAARAAAMRYTKRHTEYLLARWTAKAALAAHLGLSATAAGLARLEVRNARDGAPEVLLDGATLPIALSLTDRAGHAVCALAPAGLAIGCDLELVEERSAAFVADYLTEAEQRLVASGGDDADRHRLANLVWSAKESALKVLRTGLRRSTLSVEVELLPTPPGAGWAPLLVRAAEGRRFPGWWRRYGDFLLTVAAESEIPPPAALEDPPRLAIAAPSHTWMRSPLR